jgi:hypothetical protein
MLSLPLERVASVKMLSNHRSFPKKNILAAIKLQGFNCKSLNLMQKSRELVKNKTNCYT